MKYAEQDKAYQAILDKYGTKETVAQKKATLDYLKGNDDYWTATLQRDAYKLTVPDQHIQSYVDYRKKQTEGKPKDYPEDLPYYEDDWWMMEHPEFYKEVYLDILKNDRKDYRSTPPTRELGAKWIAYNKIENNQSARDLFRLQNPDLDSWGVSIGIWERTMSDKSRRKTQTTAERGREDISTLDKLFYERLTKVGAR